MVASGSWELPRGRNPPRRWGLQSCKHEEQILPMTGMSLVGRLGAQSVKRPAFDFDSGHDITVHEFEPRVGLCADSSELPWDSLSHFTPSRLKLTHSLSK